MTTSSITVWHCDADGCDASAPEAAPGWTDSIYTHGCPAHGEAVEAHRAKVWEETHRRKTYWYLTCRCGWRPPGTFEMFSTRVMRAQHLAHLKSATASAVGADRG